MSNKPRIVPQPATCQGYDSAVDSVIADTLVSATRKSTSSTKNPPKSYDRYNKSTVRDPSDSGYSSHVSDTQESKISAETPPQHQTLPIRPAQKAATKVTESVPAKARSVGRSNSTSTRRPVEQPARTTPSPTKRKEICRDPDCHEADCVNAKPRERRPSSTVRERAPAEYGYAPPSNTFSTRQYHEPDVDTSSQTTARPMATSTRRSRPQSMHEGYSYSGSYDKSIHGPPPSTSASFYPPHAYEDFPQSYHYPIQQEQLAYSDYYQPGNAGPEGYFRTAMPQTFRDIGYATRYAETARYPAPEALPAPTRTYSTREMLPRSYPDDQGFYDEAVRSPYEQDSGLGLIDDAYVSEKAQKRAYDAQPKAAPLSRRSSTKKRPELPLTERQRSRVDPHRKSKSHDYYDERSYPERKESKRSSRAFVDDLEPTLRPEYRPALSRNPSSSSRSRNLADSGRYVSTRPTGRDAPALSSRELRQREQDEIDEQNRERSRRAEQQRDAEAYQKRVEGARPPELSAASLKKTDRRHSVASVSQRSSRSSRMSRNQDIMLTAGGAQLQISGASMIEVQRDENGDLGRITISNVSGREKSYHGGSRSSGSRVGRSRAGSELGGRYEQVIDEEEYEPAL